LAVITTVVSCIDPSISDAVVWASNAAGAHINAVAIIRFFIGVPLNVIVAHQRTNPLTLFQRTFVTLANRTKSATRRFPTRSLAMTPSVP